MRDWMKHNQEWLRRRSHGFDLRFLAALAGLIVALLAVVHWMA